MRKKRVKNKTLESISNRLRQIRHHFNCGQNKMSQMIGIGKMTYGKNERGQHLPNTTTLISLHQRLGLSIEWFLFGHGPMYWKEIRDENKDAQELESFNQELNEMIFMMKRISLLYHSIMMHYQTFKIDNKALIREQLGEEEKEQEEN